MAVQKFQQTTCSALESTVRVTTRVVKNIISSLPVSSVAPFQRPKVAIIGTGITGIGAACQCLDSGFDISIFEASSSADLGGIWTASQAHTKPM